MNSEQIAQLLESAVCRAEAARIAGVCAQTVGTWISRGRVEHGKRYYLSAARWEGGDMVIILRKDLDDWFKDIPANATESTQKDISVKSLDLHELIQPGDLVFDVGGCEGAKTCEYLNHGASRVIAFEPNPIMQEFLRKRFEEEPRVTVDPNGLWEKNGILRFHISTDNPATSTFIDSVPEYYNSFHEPDYIQWDKDAEVTVITLDDAFALYGIPSFIKIDVESAEEYVLRGMHTVVPALSFEFYPAPLNTFVIPLNILRQLGYMRFNYIISPPSHLGSERFDYSFDDWVDYETIFEKLCKEPINKNSVYGDIYTKA